MSSESEKNLKKMTNSEVFLFNAKKKSAMRYVEAMQTIRKLIVNLQSALATNGIDNGQSQSRGTFFLLRALVETFEDTRCIQSLIGTRIAKRDAGRSDYDELVVRKC